MTNPGVNTRLLYRFFVKLDFRDKNKAGFTKIIGVLLAYLFANTLLSFGNYAGFDEFSYVILSMSTNVFLLAFVVMNDFVNLFVGKGEGEAIQSLPVKEEKIFFARFFAAYTMIAFFALSIVLPQIYFFSKYGAGALSVVLFIFCIFLFNIFFISFLVMVYTLVLRYAKKTAHYFIYAVNIFFLVYVFYSTSLKGKAASLGKSSLLEFSFVNYLPQTFFARGLYEPLVLLILLVSSIALCVLAFLTIRRNFSAISASSSEMFTKTNKPRKNTAGVPELNPFDKFMNRFFLRNNHQKAGYYLLKYQLSNSRGLKMRYYIFAFMPIVFTLIAVFANIPGAVVFPSGKIPFASENIALLSPGILLIFIMSARLIVSNSRIADSNSNDINWMYESLPVAGPGGIRMGILKFITVYFFIPVSIIMGAVISVKMDPVNVLLNLVYSLAGVFFISSVLFSMDKSYPFSLDSSRMDSTGKFLEVLFTIILGGIIFASMLFVFKNIIFIIISIAVLLLAGSLILKIQRRS